MKWIVCLCALALALAFSTEGSAQPSQRRRGRGPSDRPREGSLKVGDPAPDFELTRLDGKGTVKLSSFKGKRPVALVFGSYT